MTAAALASAHQQFEAALPAIRQTTRYALRRRRRDRDDLVAEAIACAWKAWRGLVARGRNPVVVGVTAIAGWAARHALKGRRIGNRHGGRNKMDIHNFRAQRLGRYKVVSYDSGPAAPDDDGPATWKKWVATDRHMDPADAAAFRIDFASWLASLTERRRLTAELLAESHGTLDVARWVGVTPAAVSQARSWLARSWNDFQGATPELCAPGPHRSCPRPCRHSGVRVRS
jgi:DNA-directed RNA polymerase specialized sigma24 family protein